MKTWWPDATGDFIWARSVVHLHNRPRDFHTLTKLDEFRLGRGFRELLRVDSGLLGLTEGRRELWRVVEGCRVLLEVVGSLEGCR